MQSKYQSDILYKTLTILQLTSQNDMFKLCAIKLVYSALVVKIC